MQQSGEANAAELARIQAEAEKVAVREVVAELVQRLPAGRAFLCHRERQAEAAAEGRLEAVGRAAQARLRGERGESAGCPRPLLREAERAVRR